MPTLDRRQAERKVSDAAIDSTGEIIRAEVPGDRHVSLNIVADISGLKAHPNGWQVVEER